VDIWEDWIVFPPEFTNELRARLDGTARAELKGDQQEEQDGTMLEAQSVYASRFKAISFQPAPESTLSVPEDAQKGGDDVDGVPIEEMDVDGVPLDEDVDGVPLDEDVDGIPLARGSEADDVDVDGEPMAEDDDVDGAPLL